jgi:hypothetical protein
LLAGLLGGAACFVLFNEYRPFDSLLPLHPFVYGFAMSGVLTWLFCLLIPAQEESQLELYFGRPPSDD